MSGRRLVRYQGVDVYAPHCWYCADDRHTDWVDLPSSETIEKAYYASATAICLAPWCQGRESSWPREVYVDRKEAWAAREPERLERRLEELREGTTDVT